MNGSSLKPTDTVLSIGIDGIFRGGGKAAPERSYLLRLDFRAQGERPTAPLPPPAQQQPQPAEANPGGGFIGMILRNRQALEGLVAHMAGEAANQNNNNARGRARGAQVFNGRMPTFPLKDP